MRKYLIERVVAYQSTTVALFDTLEEALQYGESLAGSGGVLVCADTEVDENRQPIPGTRTVYRIW